MDFNNYYIDELVELREKARESKDWGLSDELRKFLDLKKAFVFDTPEGQVVLHSNKFKDRKELEDYIKEQRRLEALVDSFTYSNLDKESIEDFNRLVELEKKDKIKDPLYYIFH